jgi:hypothetical protein
MHAILLQRFSAQVFTFLGIKRDPAAVQYFLYDVNALAGFVFRVKYNV